MYYLIVHKDIRDKVREEFSREIILPHQAEHVEMNWTSQINQEKLRDLNYLNMCINESLRIDPPFKVTSTLMVTEPIDLCGYTIRDDHML